MTVAALLERAAATGVEVFVVDGAVKLRGPVDAVNVVAATMREHRDQVLEHLRDAVSTPSRPLPDALAQQLDNTVMAGLYPPDDAAFLSRFFSTDPVGVRTLIEDMHSRVPTCRRCEHFRRPGLSDGYCVGRDDLTVVYGRMHARPADDGATCKHFEAQR